MNLPLPTSPAWRRVLHVAAGAGAALVALVFVYELAAQTGARFGHLAPYLMVGAVVLPAAALAVLGDPRLGILGVFVVFPVGFTPLPGGVIDLVQGAVLGVSGLIALRRLRTAEGVLGWSPAYWWVVAWLAWTLIGVPSAADPSLAMRRLLIFAPTILFGTAIIAACRNQRDVRLLALGLLTVVGLVAGSSVAGVNNVRSDFGGTVVSGRASGMFSEPNQLGSFAAVGALVGIGLALGARSRSTRIASWLLVAGSAGGMLLSLSRGAWIGFALGMVILLVHVPAARRTLAVGTIALFAAALVYGSLRPTSPEVEVVGQRFQSTVTAERNPYDDRPSIWAEARREIKADPLTGHGLGNFPIVARRSTSRSHTTFPPHAHNLFLNWAAEAGIPAVVFMIAFAAHVGGFARRVLRRLRSERRAGDAAVVAGLAGAAAVVLGQGLVDYTLWSSVVLAELASVLGLLLAALELER